MGIAHRSVGTHVNSSDRVSRTSQEKLPFRVLLITDANACLRQGRGVVETVARALLPTAPGCAVLVRSKRAATEDVAACCNALRPITRRAGALLFVHTHLELVAALDLDGAHLSSTAPTADARGRVGPHALVGASRHVNDPLDDGTLAHLDYVTVGPVFQPMSKPDDMRPTLGVEGLARCAANAARPVVALGGITASTARASRDVGAAAIAVIGAVMSAHDPRRALVALLDDTQTP